MFKAKKKCSRAGILIMEVVPLLILALDVRLGLGRCYCSSPGSFLMAEANFLAKAIGCYKCRCVLCASLHLLSPQHRNFTTPIPHVVVFLVFSSSLFFCFSLLFADLVAGLVLFKFVSSCSCV